MAFTFIPDPWILPVGLAALTDSGAWLRGLGDAEEDRLPKSNHPAYQEAYQGAAIVRMAERRELVLTTGLATSCESCGRTVAGLHLECPLGCVGQEGDRRHILWGHWCLFGADLAFYDIFRLRQLMAQGLTIRDTNGVPLDEYLSWRH